MTEEKDIQNTQEQAEQAPPKSKLLTFVDEMLDWIESFVFASFMVLLVFIFLFRTVVVDGGSMEPTLYNEQRLILAHFDYEPKRGDIIVANAPGLNKTIIKRCIGISGDKVVIDYDANTVTVNGEVIEESYLGASTDMRILDMVFDDAYRVSENVYEYNVPEGTIFVMGDNRNNSRDSRAADVGFVNKSDILGRAAFRFYVGEENPGSIGMLD